MSSADKWGKGMGPSQAGFIDQSSKLLRILGIVIIIAGLQSYGYYSNYVPQVNAANQDLDRLTDEIATNSFTNKVLNDLGDLRRISEDEAYKREIVQIYERFIGEFLEDRIATIDEFVRITETLDAPEGPLGEESLDMVKTGAKDLQNLYADQYQPIIDSLDSPPLYLQPTAAFLKSGSSLKQNLMFNHGVYLSLTGDRTNANKLFNDLENMQVDNAFLTVVHYAQARMLYDAFQSEGQFDYYQQAIQSLKESLRSNPEYGQPKLFLEYLLSLDRGSQEVNAPVTGDGSGEAEGERGVISSAPPNF